MPSVPDYTSVTDALSSDLLYLIRGSGTDRDRNITVSDLLKTLVALTGDQDVEGTKVFLDGIGLSSGRKFADHKRTSAVTSSGWYNFAYIPHTTTDAADAEFKFTCYGSGRVGSVSCHMAGTNAANANRQDICDISIPMVYNVPGTYNPFRSVRLARNRAGTGGVWGQVYVDVSVSNDVTCEMVKNIGSRTGVGFVLLDALAAPTAYLPDGTTLIDTSDYLEAGATFDRNISGATVPISNLDVYTTSTTNLRCIFTWDEIPKQNATSIALSYLASNLFLKTKGTSTTVYTFSGSEIIGAPTVKGKIVMVNITLDSAVTSAQEYDIIGSTFVATLS